MMKVKTVTRLGILSSTLLATSQTQAGELSATLALDANSHFVSYGFNVWGASDEPDFLFNPSLGVDYAVNDVFSLNAGIWMDINAQTGSFEAVETDIWIGASYDLGFGSVSATFQNWQYNGASEEVLDIGFSLNTFLSPTLTLHQRLGAGASGGEEGLFVVGSVSHDFELTDRFSLGLSSSVGFGATDFHTITVTDAVTTDVTLPSGEVVTDTVTPAVTENNTGFGFASFGASLSYAVSDTVSVYGSMTYYITDEDTIGNSEDNFLTFGTGMSFSF